MGKQMKTKIFQIILTTILLSLGFSSIQAQKNSETAKQLEAKIFLQRTLEDPSGTQSQEISFVKRMIDAKSPLRSALEHLFSPNITAEELEKGYYTATFGLKFEGVTLSKGTATVRFSQPPEETNYGSLGPMIFAEAIEKTVKQFKSVNRVKICAIGETMIDSQLETPFPKCRK